MAEFQTVASVEDIPNNSSKCATVDGIDVLVCNSGGEFVALENRCSHQDKPLTGGRIRNGYIFCPVHGMRFRLANGEALGQLTRVPLNVFETRVENGRIQVRLEPAGE